MATPIIVNYSTETGYVPLAADLIVGEVFLNLADGRSYMLDDANAVQSLESVVALTEADVTSIIAQLKGAVPDALNDLPKILASLGYAENFAAIILDSLRVKETDIGGRYTAAQVQTMIDARPAATLEATSSELVLTRLNEAVLGSWICATPTGYKLASLNDGFTEALGVVTGINTQAYTMTVITSGLTSLDSDQPDGSTLYLQPDGSVSASLSGTSLEKAVGKVVTGKVLVDVNQTRDFRADTPVGAPLITTMITGANTVIDTIPEASVHAVQWLICIDDLAVGSDRRNTVLMDAVITNGAVVTSTIGSDIADVAFTYNLSVAVVNGNVELSVVDAIPNGVATVRRLALGDDITLDAYEAVPI